MIVIMGGWGLAVICVKPTLDLQVSVTLVTLAGLGHTVTHVTMAGQMFPVTLVTQTLDLQDFVTLVSKGGLGLTVLHVTQILNHQECVMYAQGVGAGIIVTHVT